MTYAIIAGLILAGVLVVLALARGWVGTAASGGQDKEARRRLEAMAEREKEAEAIKAGPTPIRLSAQLERLRARLARRRR